MTGERQAVFISHASQGRRKGQVNFTGSTIARHPGLRRKIQCRARDADVRGAGGEEVRPGIISSAARLRLALRPDLLP